MPLSSEQIYNDLSGEEVKQILVTRFVDLLNGVPEFQRHITLPRVQMNLMVHLEIASRTPPTVEIVDDLTITVKRKQLTFQDAADQQQAAQGEYGDNSGLDDMGVTTFAAMHDLSAEINSNTSTSTGQPPDQIREEHGLAVNEPTRGAFGIEDKPVIRDGRKWGAFVEQDFGPARQRTGLEGPLGQDVITVKNTHRGEVAPIKDDFRNMSRRD